MRRSLPSLLFIIFFWTSCEAACTEAVCTRVYPEPLAESEPSGPAAEVEPAQPVETYQADAVPEPEPEPAPEAEAEPEPEPELPPPPEQSSPPEQPPPMEQQSPPEQPPPPVVPEPATDSGPVLGIQTTESTTGAQSYPQTSSWSMITSYSAPAATCPCTLEPGTNRCMNYDRRFVATSVEEAIVYFPDLQMSQVPRAPEEGVPETGASGNHSQVPPSTPFPSSPSPGTYVEPPSTGGKTLNASASSKKSGKGNAGGTGQPPSGPPPAHGLCGNDMECYECSSALLNRLGASGMMSPEEVEQVSKKFGLDPSNRRKGQTKCEKYHFTLPPTPSFALAGAGNGTTGNDTDPELTELVRKLQAKGAKLWTQTHRTTPSAQRRKRQGTSTNIGQQYKIDCTKRGEPVELGSDWVGLCNVCWAWRKLPNTYFPQFINELLCDTDTKCMSGFASCKQRHKSVDILQNTGKPAAPVWKQVTISVANYCDCEVQSGSSLHNFVAA